MIMTSAQGSIPVLLLKTKSIPTDEYEQRLISTSGLTYEPRFVPVLVHKFFDDSLQIVRTHLLLDNFDKGPDKAYGGFIFTSQRAVEAFARLIEEGRSSGEGGWPHLQNVPIYTVGPATCRALRAISLTPPLRIFGEETGNGEALAHYILDHYGQWYQECHPKPPLLFLVGEQRRDIIPKTLMDPSLNETVRIHVDELAVYGTETMESFEQDLTSLLDELRTKPIRWIVVFSPTGCEAMLRILGMLDNVTGHAIAQIDSSNHRTYIATIGPTTRDYLRREFAYEPDLCAEKPSPEGVQQGIDDFMSRLDLVTHS